MTTKQLLDAAGPVSRFVPAQTAELIMGLASAVRQLTEQLDAVVQARTLTADLQYERFAYGESYYDDGHARGWNAHKIEVEKSLRSACAAAGITLVVRGVKLGITDGFCDDPYGFLFFSKIIYQKGLLSCR